VEVVKRLAGIDYSREVQSSGRNGGVIDHEEEASANQALVEVRFRANALVKRQVIARVSTQSHNF
jgi:hypothetical protein